MLPRHVLDRLHRAVQTGEVYLAPADRLPPSERAAAREVLEALALGPDVARSTVERLHAEGRLGKVARASALHVVAASPDVRDFAEACRMADLQEFLALEEGGPHLLARLASADRHRGVVAFLMGRYSIALEWFSRAFERERTPENLGNVLAALLALGERREAHELMATVRRGFPSAFQEDLVRRIGRDDDLRELRPSL